MPAGSNFFNTSIPPSPSLSVGCRSPIIHRKSNYTTLEVSLESLFAFCKNDDIPASDRKNLPPDDHTMIKTVIAFFIPRLNL